MRIFICLFLFASNLLAQRTKTIEGINLHSLELSRTLYNKGENLFCSPLSLSTALAMTYAGANGKNAEEYETVMHYPGEKTFEEIKSFSDRLNSIGKLGNVSLNIDNALWHRTALKPDFTARMNQSFGASFYPLTGAKPINDWANEKTKGRIPKVLEESDITPDIKLVLTNAIYFKGKWKSTFDSTTTHDAIFYKTDKQEANCRMMYQKSKFKYLQNEQYQAIELPYSGDEIVMQILLPNQNSSVEKLLQEINSEKLDLFERQGKMQDVMVFLPRFKMETTYNLIAPLKSMGLNLPFSGGDFSKMAAERLEISKIVQKAFVEVKEEGTEAAAVTVILMQTTSTMGQVNDLVPQFRADRPFFFLLREKSTGLILFTGVVENPDI
jgi:serpin B